LYYLRILTVKKVVELANVALSKTSVEEVRKHRGRDDFEPNCFLNRSHMLKTVFIDTNKEVLRVSA
jgi:hypothetical protein